MTTTTEKSTKTEKAPAKLGRKTLRKLGRDKRSVKLHADKEFAKTYFAAKSKRAADKKVGFRKKKSKKA